MLTFYGNMVSLVWSGFVRLDKSIFQKWTGLFFVHVSECKMPTSRSNLPRLAFGSAEHKTPDGFRARRNTLGTGENVLEEKKEDDTPYKQEKFDAGCYRTVINFDRLDQQ